MENKTIQDIKEEYAKSLDNGDFKSYAIFRDYNELQEEDLDAICFLYASQFQKKVENQEKQLCVLYELLDRIQNHEVNIDDNIDRLINITINKLSKIKQHE